MSKKNKFRRIVTILAIIIFGITAYFSDGFYHADEHYQIIEFANMRLGNSQASELPWEFNAKIRSTIQVVIAMAILKTATLLSVTNPFTQLFLLRLLTSLFSIIAIYFFVKKTQNDFSNSFVRKTYFFLSFFLWFIPFISVRFSSEIWSGLFFLMTIILYLKKENRPYYMIGVFAGLSFLFRYQILFSLLGFVLWAILIDKENFKNLLKSSSMFVIVCAVGFIIDSWFYNSVTFVPYNYFYKNIIENISSNYGTSPWYFYFQEIIYSPYLFFGLPIFLSLLLFTIKKPKHIFTWILIPFILGHSAIGHKEVRFLFPIIFFSAYILTFGVNNLYSYFNNKRVLKFGIITFLFLNFSLSLLHSFKANGRGRLSIAKFIYNNFSDNKVAVYSKPSAYLFDDPLSSSYFPMHFYDDGKIDTFFTNDLCGEKYFNNGIDDKFIVLEYKDLTDLDCNLVVKEEFLASSLPIPKPVLRYFILNDIQISKIDKMLLLYKVK